MSSKTMTVEIPARDAAKLGNFLKQIVSALDQAKKRMRRDQVEIDPLNAETPAVLT